MSERNVQVLEDSNGSLKTNTNVGVAKVGGEPTQSFKVADAVNADEALTLGQLSEASASTTFSISNGTAPFHAVSLHQLDSRTSNMGKVLQVVQNHVTATSSQSLTLDVRAEILNLNATITPTSIDSKILVTVRWNGEGSSTTNHDTVFGINRIVSFVAAVDVGNPPDAGIRHTGIAIISQGFTDLDAASTPDSCMYEYMDTPLASAPAIYPVTFNATILSGVTQTMYNNRGVADADSTAHERLTSTITLTEIGV